MTAGLVLAAGRASRYRAAGGTLDTKLVAPVRGEALVRYPARAALAAGLDPVLVVTGHAAAAVRGALDGLPVRVVHNAGFEAGLATSLVAGLAALPLACNAVIVLLGDMPLLDHGVIAALLDGARDDPVADAVVPVAEGRRGNPVLLRRTLFAAAARLTGDEGARRLLASPTLRVREVPMQGSAVLLDADDPQALAAFADPGEKRPDAP